MASAESLAFQQAYDVLAQCLELQTSPLDIANKLYSRKVIGIATKNNIGHVASPKEKARILLCAVESAIRINPTNFDKFISSLSEEPVFSEIVTQLVKSRTEATRRKKSESDHPYSMFPSPAITNYNMHEVWVLAH